MSNQNTQIEPVVIFDNGGGATLQLPGFSHYYDHMDQLAVDIVEWARTHTTHGWDGNEPESAVNPNTAEIASGGYLVMTLEELFGDLGNRDSGWGNVDDVRRHLSL